MYWLKLLIEGALWEKSHNISLIILIKLNTYKSASEKTNGSVTLSTNDPNPMVTSLDNNESSLATINKNK